MLILNIMKNYSSVLNKLKDLQEDLNNPEAIKEKILALYNEEFEDKITTILIEKESDFMRSFNSKMQLILEDLYSNEAYENEAFISIVKNTELFMYEEVYKKSLCYLRKGWEEYENTIKQAESCRGNNRKSSLDELIDPVNSNSRQSESNVYLNSNIFYLKNFRKHCRQTEFATHVCKGRFIPIFNDENILSYVICVNCKFCFFARSILMHCNSCDVEYYSCYVFNLDKEFQPATWEKYHCGALINEQMRCIKCKEKLYIRLANGDLHCKSCKYETDPTLILWRCMLCTKEFRSKAKIYNPMEFKMIKRSILNAILGRVPARPTCLSCCSGENMNELEFFHKMECKGQLFFGELKNKKIVVCSLCRAMASYEKFNWTCPICMKRFRDIKINEGTNENFYQSGKGSIFGFESLNTNEDYLKTEESTVPERTQLKKNTAKPKNISLLGDKLLDNDEPSTIDKEESKRRSYGRIRNTTCYLGNQVSSSAGKPPLLFSPSNKFKIAYPQTLEIPNEDQDKEINPGSLRNFMTNKPIRPEKENPSKGPIKTSNIIFPGKNSPVTKEIKKSKEPEVESIRSRVRGKTSVSYTKESFEKMQLSQQNDSQPKTTEGFNPPKEEEKSTPVQLCLQETEDLNNQIYIEVEEKLKEFNFEEYSVITHIGEGTFGKIYLVEDKHKNIFSMKKIIANDDIELEFFLEEYQLVNKVRHPNILQILGICKRKLDLTTWAIYVLMEVGVTDWEKEIKTRQVTKQFYKEKELMDILRQLVSALTFLQKHNISHRDIKPQNILLFKNSVYKIADFGEAKQISKLETNKQFNTLRGTELFMSPVLFNALRHNINDIKHNCYKSDVFSLGFCLFYGATLSQKVLYELRTVTESQTVNLYLHKSLRNRFSAPFINLLGKMLEINEGKRYDFLQLEEILKEMES